MRRRILRIQKIIETLLRVENGLRCRQSLKASIRIKKMRTFEFANKCKQTIQ